MARPSAISSVVQIETGDLDAPGHALIDEQTGGCSRSRGRRYSARVGLALGSAGLAPPRPCQFALPSARRTRRRSAPFEEDAVGDHFAAQQRNELHAELRALPGHQGLRAEARRVAEAGPRPCAEPSQGKKPSSMSPTSVNSRPVRSRTAASMFDLKLLGSTSQTITSTPSTTRATSAPRPSETHLRRRTRPTL